MLQHEEIKEIAAQLQHDNIARKGLEEFEYQGPSMKPALADGDIISIKPVLPESLFLGDLVVYRKCGQFIVHRFLYRKFVKSGLNEIVAKADNSFIKDAPFSYSCLCGKAVRVLHENKYLELGKRSWRIAFCCIGVFSLSEAAIFRILCGMKRRLFNNLKIGRPFRQRIEKVVRIPIRLLIKAVFQR